MLSVQLAGGLGNQLFQLAFLEYATNLTGKSLNISNIDSPKTVHGGDGYYETIFKYWKQFYKSVELPVVRENSKMQYQDWSKISDCKLSGYFQRHEYILPNFVSKLTFDDSILSKYPDISSKYFIHIRGGDYKGNSFHEMKLTNYYRTCLELCDGNDFVIFTNDIDYAKELLPNYQIIQENELDSLLLMSKCKGCICTNSTFSWWGAFMNRNRPIYFPNKWWNDTSMDASGLYFPECTIVELNILDKIEKVVYINLAHRKDRKEQIEKQLSVFPENKVIRFDAIHEKLRGHLGCSKSHIAVLEMAIANKWGNCLIVEDDMVWNSFDSSCRILRQLYQKKGDVIVLGGTAVEYDEATYKLKRCCCTTAYLVFDHYYETLLSNFKEGAKLLEKNYKLRNTYAIDQYWHTLQKRDNWFIVQPNMCIQKFSYSDTQSISDTIVALDTQIVKLGGPVVFRKPTKQ